MPTGNQYDRLQEDFYRIPRVSAMMLSVSVTDRPAIGLVYAELDYLAMNTYSHT
jgi:hypothetical protein